MGRYVEVHFSGYVAVDMADIDTEDLEAELESRRSSSIDSGEDVVGINHLLEKLYQATVFGHDDIKDDLVKEIVYRGIGKII